MDTGLVILHGTKNAPPGFTLADPNECKFGLFCNRPDCTFFHPCRFASDGSIQSSSFSSSDSSPRQLAGAFDSLRVDTEPEWTNQTKTQSNTISFSPFVDKYVSSIMENTGAEYSPTLHQSLVKPVKRLSTPVSGMNACDPATPPRRNRRNRGRNVRTNRSPADNDISNDKLRTTEKRPCKYGDSCIRRDCPFMHSYPNKRSSALSIPLMQQQQPTLPTAVRYGRRPHSNRIRYVPNSYHYHDVHQSYTAHATQYGRTQLQMAVG